MLPVKLDDLIIPNDNELMAFDCHNFPSKKNLSNRMVPLPTALDLQDASMINYFT